MRIRFERTTVAVIALLAGCVTMKPALQDRIEEEAVLVSPAATDDEAVLRVALQAAESERPPIAEVDLAESAGLDDYVQIALGRNPSIHRAIRQIQALGFQFPQVTSLDDPMLNLVPPTGDMTQTASGMMGGSLGLAQRIPFPGKLSARGRVVEEAAWAALHSLTDIRISIVARVQKAYYSYYLASISIDINRDSQRLVRQIRDVAAARYRAGAATQQDVLRAEVELYSLTNELITLEQQRETARALLNTMMNRRVDALLPPPRALDLAEVGWKLEAAMERAVVESPRLARLRTQIRRDLEMLRLAHLGYYPDVTAGYTYTFISGAGVSPVASGDDVWNLAFGINLPIWWQRLRARVLEVNAQALASVEELTELRNMIFFELQDTLVRIDTQYRRAVLFRDLIVPRAWQAVEVSTSSYQAGTLEFTALIENWRKWLDSSLAHHRAAAELEQQFADLQQLIGIRLPRAPEPAAEAPAAVQVEESDAEPRPVRRRLRAAGGRRGDAERHGATGF